MADAAPIPLLKRFPNLPNPAIATVDEVANEGGNRVGVMVHDGGQAVEDLFVHGGQVSGDREIGHRRRGFFAGSRRFTLAVDIGVETGVDARSGGCRAKHRHH
jgi:hypothetical protein